MTEEVKQDNNELAEDIEQSDKIEPTLKKARPVWLMPVAAVALLALIVVGYFGFSYLGQVQAEQARAGKLVEMNATLNQNTFFDGIFIDDIDLGGKTYEEAKAIFAERNQTWYDSFTTTLKLDDETLVLTADDMVVSTDWLAVLDQAWAIGRDSEQTDEYENARERYEAVAAVAAEPKHFVITQKFDPSASHDRIVAKADSLNIAPAGAIATGFDLVTKKFIIVAGTPGRTIDSEAAATAVLELLAAGKTGRTVMLTATANTTGLDTAAMEAKLGLVSEAVTLAQKVNSPRDSNIRLICKMINGLVLQPGESFSFNGFIGERTAAKGFKEAGGIRGGILIQELGGGICQPNTTLCQAVLKADLQIDERHPHSWPSDYTDVGLDATVSWDGPNFKFTNDTEYPVAIVCYYNKPSIVFQIYGRLLDPGVSIVLKANVTGTIAVTAPPTEVLNPSLAPGARVEVRGSHTGRSAIAYKIWMKDGKEFKREVAFTSVYKPLNQIFEVGPPVTPTETTVPTTTENTAPTSTETTETTAPT